MPHFRCLACKSRLYSASTPAGAPCPGCGSPLESVGALAELAGLRLISSGSGDSARRTDAGGGGIAALAAAVALPVPNEKTGASS
jgi:hypothetical protein